MKPPLIFLSTRDDDFAQSVREPLFGTGGVVLGLTILVAVSSYLVRGSTHHPSGGNAKSHTRAIAAR
jgi:hypothetical protein